MKRILYILFFISIGTTYAQQDAMFTYYMFNHQAVNPAYVGSRQIINGTMLNRSQWTGFVGAPWSHTVSLNMPLLNKTMGFGASFSNDVIGPSTLNNFFPHHTASYATNHMNNDSLQPETLLLMLLTDPNNVYGSTSNSDLLFSHAIKPL